MKTKNCPKCNEEKKHADFNKNSSRKDGLQNYCRKCQKEIDKKFQPKRDLTKKRKQLDEKRNANRKSVFEYLENNSCVDCGEKDILVLQFDHIKDKKHNISDMIIRGYSLNKIFEEIKKCEVRCANCHARKTAKQQGWYKLLK